MRVFLGALLLLLSSAVVAQGTLFSQANCTIIYSLEGWADKQFNDDMQQLKPQLHKQSVQFIDLNHWRQSAPHLKVSGRARNQLRQEYSLTRELNQTVIIGHQGRLIQRYSGSISLVNALFDCATQ